MRVIPILHASIFTPALVIEWISALPDHAVDASRAAQYLSARMINLAVIHKRLRLRFVFPVVVLIADRKG